MVSVEEIQVFELGLQVHVDASGEDVSYYAIGFQVQHDGQDYGLLKSLDPETVPGDPEYDMAIETGKRTLLKKVLQEAE